MAIIAQQRQSAMRETATVGMIAAQQNIGVKQRGVDACTGQSGTEGQEE